MSVSLSVLLGRGLLLRPLQQAQTQTGLIRHFRGRKDKIYGYEDGHSSKNEVRKDKWMRKYRKKRTGIEWRIQQSLSPDPFRSHALSTSPDWKFKDGRSGYLTQDQSDAVHMMRDMCQDVHEALKLVKRKV